MHEGHRERLKDRFIENGLEGFADHEVLELLLGYAIPRKDVNPLAHSLIDTFGSLSGVLHAHPLDLVAVKGVGHHAAVLLALIRTVSSRARLAATNPMLLNSPQATVSYLCTLCSGSKTEQFYILMLDSQNRLKYTLRLNEGTVNESTIYPRTIVEGALRHGAASVILAHNHPSGSLEPSAEDIETTHRMQAALSSIGIRMLEHFVVGENAAYAITRNKAFQCTEEKTQAPQPNTCTSSKESTASEYNPLSIVENFSSISPKKNDANRSSIMEPTAHDQWEQSEILK